MKRIVFMKQIVTARFVTTHFAEARCLGAEWIRARR